MWRVVVALCYSTCLIISRPEVKVPPLLADKLAALIELWSLDVSSVKGALVLLRLLTFFTMFWSLSQRSIKVCLQLLVTSSRVFYCQKIFP
jgi:hypothetical protein